MAMAEISGWYPVVVRESRYSGAYANGNWVLSAGAFNPSEMDAFGGDTECNSFWNKVASDGPIITIRGPFGEREVYFASGNDPNTLISEAKEYLSNR